MLQDARKMLWNRKISYSTINAIYETDNSQISQQFNIMKKN